MDSMRTKWPMATGAPLVLLQHQLRVN
jgi:hypothetical protein